MERYDLTRPVFLIGFMGAGKTTVGRRLARRCGLASVDLDRSLERESGMRLRELFETVGEERFREMEACALERYCSGYPLLISCGGGTVCGQRSAQIIGERGFAVHLMVSACESSERISNHETRPFFDCMDSINDKSRQRMPIYRRLADATIDTCGKSPERLARELQEILEKEGILCLQRK